MKWINKMNEMNEQKEWSEETKRMAWMNKMNGMSNKSFSYCFCFSCEQTTTTTIPRKINKITSVINIEETGILLTQTHTFWILQLLYSLLICATNRQGQFIPSTYPTWVCLLPAVHNTRIE